MPLNRLQLVTSLLEFDVELDFLREQLSKFSWDSEEHVRCLPRHIRTVLQRYLIGALSSDEVEEWANLIEGRDDIELPSPLGDVIFELANPQITKPLAHERAAMLVGSLID